ncbi:MAG TPA: hypothetical protein VKQ06_13095 [Gammaproteobacteria bacterium]|nr:hypothetical protein [Gammaproteobacteria bacterium]
MTSSERVRAESSGFAPDCVAASLFAAALLLAIPAGAQDIEPEWLGRWTLVLELENASHSGLLEIEPEGAFVDGGPVAFTTDGNRVTMEIDTRDGGGRLLSYQLSGRLNDGAMSGVLQPPLDAPEGRWHAQPVTERATQRPPQPVDFSGIWSRVSSGIAKVHLDYTPAARTAVDEYHYLDDMALRCVSPGVVRVSGWPYPLEVIQTDDQLTILYESFHEVRRIHIDGRGFPEHLPPRAMGYSVGHWDGSTLVVETRQLTAGFVDLAGQPLSENARVVERMSLEDGGQTYRSEMTIDDPENYNRPITRYRVWRKTPETIILEYDCDPYPFFRGLEIEGKLDEYWDRMRRRQ